MSGDNPSKGLPAIVPSVETVSSEVVQELNVVHGHMSGRDIHDNSIGVQHNIVLPPAPETELARLYRRLAQEADGDRTLTAFIRQLEIYTRQVQDEKVAGLEAKLAAADRDAELDMAMAMKEAVFADLRENLFSPTYQRIAATLMGKIHEAFNANVKPLVDTGASKQHIDHVVSSSVVGPMVAELESCPDFYDAPVQLVRGMLYFLTGNCHIRWH